jgi:hypothetical protein
MKSIGTILAVSTVWLLSSCSFNDTRMINSWVDPNQGTTPITFNKILVVGVAPTSAEQRTAEDTLVTRIGEKASPAYNVLTPEEMKSPETIEARLKGSAYDGVVLVRWVGARTEKEVQTTPLYSPRWNPYSSSWTYMQENTLSEWSVLQLETKIFNVSDNRLIWSGTTETVEPREIPKLINDVADVVQKQLRKQGLLPPPTKEKK